MKIYVNVKMKTEFIYDLLLFHTYSRLSGFLVNLLGLMVIMAGGFLLKRGEIRLLQTFLYLACGLAVLCFTPFCLKLQARKLMRQPRYGSSIVYGFDEHGIEETVGDSVNFYTWNHVERAVSTPKDIAFYTNEASALVLPKESFGNNFIPIMKLVTGNMTGDQIFIR